MQTRVCKLKDPASKALCRQPPIQLKLREGSQKRSMDSPLFTWSCRGTYNLAFCCSENCGWEITYANTVKRKRRQRKALLAPQSLPPPTCSCACTKLQISDILSSLVLTSFRVKKKSRNNIENEKSLRYLYLIFVKIKKKSELFISSEMIYSHNTKRLRPQGKDDMYCS